MAKVHQTSINSRNISRGDTVPAGVVVMLHPWSEETFSSTASSSTTSSSLLDTSVEILKYQSVTLLVYHTRHRKSPYPTLA